MTTVNITNEQKNLNLHYDDLNDGDIFIDQDGDYMMKVRELVTEEPKNFVLCLQNFELYDDVDNYKIKKLVDANILI